MRSPTVEAVTLKLTNLSRTMKVLAQILTIIRDAPRLTPLYPARPRKTKFVRSYRKTSAFWKKQARK